MAEASECAVLVDCNLFRQKSHTNPISRLLEPIANGETDLLCRSRRRSLLKSRPSPHRLYRLVRLLARPCSSPLSIFNRLPCADTPTRDPPPTAIEHGRAARVDVAMDRAESSGELCFSVTEHGGAGMTPLECEEAIRFGLHAAKPDATTLHNYSHNGIGTKACLNIWSRLAIFSIHAADGARTYVLLLLDVADTLGHGKCKPAIRFVCKFASKPGVACD